MTYEELIEEYQSEVDVIEHNLRENPLINKKGGKGFYYREPDQEVGVAIIDASLSSIDKKCTLAEEIGHHFTSNGNILQLKYGDAKKQERRAREWGAVKLVSPDKLFMYCELYDWDLYKVAEEMQVTTEIITTYLKYISEKGLLSLKRYNL